MPPAGQGWYARMERQSPTPPPPVDPPTTGGPPRSEPPTAVLPAGPPGMRPKQPDQKGTRPPGGPPGRPSARKRNRGLALWSLGALILAAAAVVAIFFQDELRGTSNAGSDETTATDRTQSTAPTEPSLGESTAPPTDAGVVPTDTAVPTTG